MEQAVNGEQMKMIDQYTIQEIGIPAMVLMERAALSVADVVSRYIGENARVLAICGSGNNGGDGVAAARILYLRGFQAEVFLAGNEERVSEETRQQLAIARKVGVPILQQKADLDYDHYQVAIDALFGIGLNRAITGWYAEIIDTMNQGHQLVFSVDIPSGLSSQEGEPMNVAVQADYTITFGLYKSGLITKTGSGYAGEITIADVGYPTDVIQAVLESGEV